MISSPPPLSKNPSSNSDFFPLNPWTFALFACFLLEVILSLRLISSFDLGFHLKGGQWILDNHAFPANDTYTYTVANHPYLDIHWFYQVYLYGVYKIGSYQLLTVFNTVLISLAFLVTLGRLRQTGAPLWMGVILLAAAVFASETRFNVRPEILSWILAGLTLWVLEARFTNKGNFLFLLPLLQLAWVNIEGLFAIGWGTMVFYLVSGYFHNRRVDKKLLRYSGLAVAACLFNPYFIRGMFFPLKLLTTLHSDVFKSSITEFLSPWALLKDFAFIPEVSFLAYKIFCGFFAFTLLATFKKRKIHEWMMAACFFFLSATASRNIPLFMLTCAPLAASSWKDIPWDWLRKFQASYLAKPLTAWAFTLFLLAATLRVATSAYYVSDRRADHFGLGLDPVQQPVQGTEFLVRNHLDGKILNHLNEGGWLDWQGPQKVFLDGRLEVMGGDFFSEFVASMKPGGLAPLVAKYNPDILFFNPDTVPQWIFSLRAMPDWRPVYLDEAVVIYLRKGYAPQVPILDDAKVLSDRGILKPTGDEAAFWLQVPPPNAWRDYAEGFYQSPVFPLGLKTIGSYYYYSKNFDLAETVFLERIKRTQGRYYDFYLDLASLYYYQLKHYNDAETCVQRVLDQDPDNPTARKIMEGIKPL